MFGSGLLTIALVVPWTVVADGGLPGSSYDALLLVNDFIFDGIKEFVLFFFDLADTALELGISALNTIGDIICTICEAISGFFACSC